VLHSSAIVNKDEPASGSSQGRDSGKLAVLRAVLLILAVSGCSFAFTANPPPPCNTSAVAPIADTATAVVSAIGAVYLATGDGDNATATAAAVGVIALGSAASAYIGYRRVSRCRDAKAAAP
jgi:predicted MFS family arabinose efflux permease